MVYHGTYYYSSRQHKRNSTIQQEHHPRTIVWPSRLWFTILRHGHYRGGVVLLLTQEEEHSDADEQRDRHHYHQDDCVHREAVIAALRSRSWSRDGIGGMARIRTVWIFAGIIVKRKVDRRDRRGRARCVLIFDKIVALVITRVLIVETRITVRKIASIQRK